MGYVDQKFKQKFAHRISLINEFLLERVNTGQQLLDNNFVSMIEAGGKRIRSVILLLSALIVRGDSQKNQEQFYGLAAAVEILHMATLVHDDIIDRAKIRRGKESIPHKLGTERALFVGDFLLARSYNLFHKYLGKELLNRVDRTIKSMCEGVISEYNNRYNLEISFLTYLKLARRKTALLFGLSTFIGGYKGGLEGRKLNLLYRFGLQLGMAFQIQDDLLDFTGQDFGLGKPVGQDLKNGVCSLPLVYLFQEESKSKKLVANLFRAETTSVQKDQKVKLNKQIQKNNILAKSRKLKKRYSKRAYLALSKFPENKARNDLEFILEYQKERRK